MAGGRFFAWPFVMDSTRAGTLGAFQLRALRYRLPSAILNKIHVSLCDLEHSRFIRSEKR